MSVGSTELITSVGLTEPEAEASALPTLEQKQERRRRLCRRRERT